MLSSQSLINTLAIVQQKLTLCIYPLWLIFGVTGCVLNLVVFSRRKLRATSCSLYFFAASVDHLMTLIVGIGPTMYSLSNPDPEIQSLLFCKIHGYILQICLTLSRWYVAFACIDRYALTSDRARLRNFADRKIAYRVILIIIIVWSIICSHRLIFYEIKENICGIVNNMGALLYHTAYIIIGGGILPTIIMIISVCLIRRNLANKERRRVRISFDNQQKNLVDNQVLKILFMQIICYIIFVIPQFASLLLNIIPNTIINQTDDYLAIKRFVAFIGELILYLFPVTSFYLYTLTSRTFRNELIKFFRLS